MGEIGAGLITKTCDKLMHWAKVAACYGVLTFGKRQGLDPNALREAMLVGRADSRTMSELHLIEMYWPHINPRHTSRNCVQADDIAMVDLHGKLAKGNSEPPSESPLHTAIYR